MLVHHMYTTLCSYWRRPLTAGIAANGFRSCYVSKISVHTVPLHLNLVHIPLSLLPFPVFSLHSPLSSPPPICTCTTFSLPPSSLPYPPGERCDGSEHWKGDSERRETGGPRREGRSATHNHIHTSLLITPVCSYTYWVGVYCAIVQWLEVCLVLYCVEDSNPYQQTCPG